MTIFTKFRAILLSVAIILTLVKFHSSSKERLTDTLTNNGTRSTTQSPNFSDTSFDEENTTELEITKKRYRNFIINDSNRYNNEFTIYILGLFELTTKYGIRNEGISEVAAAQLAVKHINSKNLLSGHVLKLLVNDTECDPGAGIDRYFHALYSNKVITMLLGTACSNVTESLASIVPYWNILQVSFGSTSPALSDRKKYPMFFRTVAPDSSHNIAKSAFIKHFKWSIIAAFSQRENTYLLPLNDLVLHLEKVNVSCAATITFGMDNLKEQLQYLKDLDVRIIVGSFSPLVAEQVFCEVYRLHMYGSDYVWILQEQQEAWWKHPRNCHSYELSKSVDGLLYIASHNQVPSGRKSMSGLTSKQFEKELQTSAYSKNVKQTYDAVWAMALVMQKVESHGRNLSEFYYDDDWFLNRFASEMQQLSFMGMSGPILFNNGDRIGNSAIKQLQDRKIKNIAVYNTESKKLDFKCEDCYRIKWQGNRVPIAKRTLKLKLISVSKVAFYIIFTISISGIIVSMFCLGFSFYYREKKIIKLSSPQLNNIAVIGCILVYLSVIFMGVNHETVWYIDNFSRLCWIRVYLLTAGFSLAFGSMFAKAYRVHRIFTYTSTSLVKKKLLKDQRLISLICLLLIIDAVILSFWVHFDPMQRHLQNLTLEINLEVRDVIYQPQVEICRSNNTSGWYIAIYGYKGFLLTMGVYMAWETRHVKVDALTDSKYIGVCVYSAVFSFMIVFACSFLKQYIVLSYVASSISILISASLTLLLLFVPKVKSVMWNGDEDQVVQSMGLKIECNTRRFIVDDPKDRVYRLEALNKAYKTEIETLDKSISHLEDLLNVDEFESRGNISHMPRASWPSSQVLNISSNKRTFSSENELKHTGKRKSIFSDQFDKIKSFMERIPSAIVKFNNANVDDEECPEGNDVDIEVEVSEDDNEEDEEYVAESRTNRYLSYPTYGSSASGPFFITFEGRSEYF